jgi:hypothetical protein
MRQRLGAKLLDLGRRRLGLEQGVVDGTGDGVLIGHVISLGVGLPIIVALLVAGCWLLVVLAAFTP